jgi:surfactin family lipopeptide synthetase A
MSLKHVFARINDKNIRVLAENGELVIQAPQGAMDAETLALLKAHKQALLDSLLENHKGDAWMDKLNRLSLPSITPDKLTLVELSQQEIDIIVATVSGGIANIQDIYPLAPLQEGILFHHLLDTQGDTYLLRTILAFENRDCLDRFVAALQKVIDRHDILRSAMFWQDLTKPVQVVCKQAQLPLEEIELQAGDVALSRLLEVSDPGQIRLDLGCAPLLHVYIVQDPMTGEWLLSLLNHHLVSDHISLEFIITEIKLLLQGRGNELVASVPYRNFIAQLRAVSSEQHEAYFRGQLADVSEPTAPFGLLDAKNVGAVIETHLTLQEDLTRTIREQARQYGVSAAVLFHVAWGQVLAQCCSRNDVVFGTVLTGRLQGSTGADRTLGMFINTLPIRMRIGDVSVRQAVIETYRNLSELLTHEQASLALAQRCSGVNAGTPLFSTLLNYRHSSENEAPEADWEGMRIIVGGEERTNYPITLSVDDFGNGNGFDLTLQCAEDVQSERVNGYMLASIGALADALVSNPDQPMCSLSIVVGDERRRILEDWNATEVEYPQGGYLHHLFEAQVDKAPDAIALTFEGLSLNYAGLNTKANQLAHYLIAKGVGPDVLVGVCIERSLEMVIGLLGILKAGGAYVPLDPAYPEGRLAFMLSDIAPIAVLTQAKFAGRDFGQVQLLSLDSEWDKVESYPAINPRRDLQPTNLAYCIYTSGSTGKPKGAGVPHQGILNRLQWMQAEYSLNASDNVLQKTPYSFDVSVWEFFWPLMTGARLVIAVPELHKDSFGLAKLIRREAVTTIHFVPSMLQAFVETPGVESCTSLQRVICSGEALPTDLVQRFQEKLPAELHNLYGPTEASVDVSYWACPAKCRETAIPIGQPIANIRLYVLDRNLNPVPTGIPGELHIAGIGLGRGYLNRPCLTSEKFIPDPFQGGGSRMYKTGDLVRYRVDGTIDYLGRIDHQVKIRGFRIEVGEIEAQLLLNQEVKETVVLAREDQPGDKRLIAYLVADQVGCLRIDELKEQLKQTLPNYMLPSAFVVLAQMPLGANGKLDRKRLQAPDIGEQLSKPYVAPRTETEAVLAEIWREVLGLEKVGVEDNFFELGGHSLLAIQLVSRVVKRFVIELPLRSIFETGNIATLAKRIDIEKHAHPFDTLDAEKFLIAGSMRTTPIPLSFAQQRLWFLDQLEPNSPFYNIPVALRLKGRIDITALTQSFQEIVRRHEVLRTIFEMGENGEPVQKILPHLKLEVDRIDLNAEQVDQALVWQAMCREEAVNPFDLQRGPLIRASLLMLADNGNSQDAILMLTMHHIVSDGWSAAVLVNEFAVLYRAFTQNQASPLAELPIQYADFACWQRRWLSGGELDRQISYWRQQLAGATGVLELPTDRPRPAMMTYRGSNINFEIPSELARQARALSSQCNVTLFMLLLAVFKLLLSRHSGQSDLCVGIPVANRNRQEIEDLIGFFVNTLVLRTNLSSNPTFAELLVQIKTTVLDAQNHQDLPFEKLVEVLQPVRDPSRSPLFQAMFVQQNQDSLALSLPNLVISGVEDESEISKFDLTLHIQDWPDGRLSGSFEFNTDLFEVETIDCFVQHYLTLLLAGIETPQRRISELPLLTYPEERQILKDWNATEVEYPQNCCIHHLFEAQAEQTPNVIALTFNELSLSYAELNGRANQLANYLITQGVGPDVMVGIYIERSLEMVVGMLGILKAGGAYVPIDPAYPMERVRYILTDADVRLVLTQSEMIGSTDTAQRISICLETNWPVIASYSSQNPSPRNHPLDTSYIIYTSGSTGQPKGVAVSHRNVVHSTCARFHKYSDPIQAYLLLSSFAFDSSVAGIFWTLSQGGCLCLPNNDASKDPVSLAELIERHQVSHLLALPSLYALLLEQAPEKLSSLKAAIVAGEACAIAVVKRHFAVLPTIKLYNEYGPTEATVWGSVYQAGLDNLERPLSIGRPISNVCLYILDSHLNPAPLGTAGELYIGGAGIVRGYLNRPELTAERFIPDLFQANGSRLYKTGDRARYHADGVIEFLGRIDHQVKIRGFRIELGEIEAHLLKHPEIKEATVLAIEDKFSGKRLVAYLVEQQLGTLDIEEMKVKLKQVLPDYMLPSRFVILEQMPLSPNGKLDRKMLPAPDFGEQHSKQNVAPRTETETRLAEIWQEVFGLEIVSIEDDFFELGGHSLLATQLAFSIEKKLQFRFPVKTVFEMPTILEQAGWLSGDVGDYGSVDLQAETQLGSDIFPMQGKPIDLSQSRSLFLTGATGFLGAFLLADLLEHTQANVYCLIRAIDESQALSRLQQQISRYELLDRIDWNRVIPVCGDLSTGGLSLSKDRYREIATSVDAIFHSGALVNFIQPYRALKAANVLGSIEVLRLAASERPKAIYYVSTLSVFSGRSTNTNGFVETDEPPLNDELTGGYAQSKWVAEAILRSAGRRGFQITVFRPATVAGDSRNGVWNTDDFMCRVFKGCVQIGLAPDIDIRLDMAPVDYISRATVTLALSPASQGQVFHLNHPTPPTAGPIFDWFISAGFSLRRVSSREWQQAIHVGAEAIGDFALASLLPVFASNSSDEPSNQEPEQYNCSATQRWLADHGVVYPSIDDVLLTRYCDYFVRSGFVQIGNIENSVDKHGEDE